MSAPGRQDFRLTWVNYSQKLTESFHKFLTSEILCNVTLWVHTKTSSNCIKAHQVREHLQMRSGKSGGCAVILTELKPKITTEGVALNMNVSADCAAAIAAIKLLYK